MPKIKSNPRSAFDNMAWSQDPLVREIYSEIDDRDIEDIAESIYKVYFGDDDDDDDDREDRGRSFEEPKSTSKLSKDEAVDATTLATQIVSWANYARAYGDYANPPWARSENPKKSNLKTKLLR